MLRERPSIILPGPMYAIVISSEFDLAVVGSGGQLHLTGAGIAKNATINGGVMTVSGSIADPTNKTQAHRRSTPARRAEQSSIQEASPSRTAASSPPRL